MVEKYKIGLVTTVSNWDLYEKTRKFFPEGIKIFAIDGTTGFYGLRSLLFLIQKLKKYDLDWVIMADEDVIFTEPANVFDLINFMDINNFTVAGMRDGGMLKWRDKNPYVINHFFAVLHLREILKIYNRKEIYTHQYIHKDEFAADIPGLPYQNYDVDSLDETYYCFYLWLMRQGKRFKYLEANNPIEGDFATTELKDHDGVPFLFHTWYARFYNKNESHTRRINKIIKIASEVQSTGSHQEPILLEKPLYDAKFHLYKFSRKIVRKIQKV